MAGKKSKTSPVGSPSSGNISDSSSKEQDRFLPIANVSRIMKKSLPANAKISKEAKETVQECVSEYISFITSEASDKCRGEKRKTINGDDLLWAMTTLGFENYVGLLKNYLNSYREIEEEKDPRAGKEDESPTNSSSDHGSNEINKASSADFGGGFSSGFYSFGTQGAPKSFGSSGRVTGYEEKLAIGAFNGNEIHENGDGNGNRAMEARLPYEVEW